MRQEVITKTYLFFEELDEKQKRKVLDKYFNINVDHYEWHDRVTSDFKNKLVLLGFFNIETFFSAFWSQGDGASFTAKFDSYHSNLQLRLKSFEECNPNYFANNPEVRELYLSLGSISEEITREGYYYNEQTMYCDNDNLLKFSRYMAKRYYRDLEETYESLTSDEAIAETLIANEFEFDLDEYSK